MIWDNFKNLLGGVGVGGGNGTLKILTEADVIGASTVSLVAGQWQTVGSYVITPQTAEQCGFGRSGVTNEQIGMLYVKLKDNATSPTEIPCSVRIAILDAEDRVRPNGYVVHSVRNDKLSVDKTDLNVGYKFPRQGIQARPYDKIALIIKPDSAVTLVKANSDIRLDTTLFA